MWNRSRREIVTEELGTLRFDGGQCWHATPEGVSVPLVLWSGRSGPDVRMLALAASVVAKVPQLEVRARRYVETLSLKHPPIGNLSAVIVQRPHLSWVRTRLAPRDQEAASAIVSGEPAVTLEFELVGERDVLDVTFVADAPVDADVR